MNSLTMTESFARSFRAKLIEHVATDAVPHRRRLFAGIGIALVVALGGTAAAAAAGLLTIPGATEYTPVATSVTETHSGTGTLDLGDVPADATGVALSFTCETPGSFSFDDGAGITCATAADSAHPATYVLPLTAIDGGRVSITTTPDATWTLTAGYVIGTISPWGVNQSGETYGITNDDGDPELIAVIATNGAQGYVHRSDLEDADGTTATKGFTSPEDALRWQEKNAGVVHLIPVY